MNETVETCGKSYCEHYPDGLFVCAKCREESTIAHDKACAKLADARAEIERLALEIENKQYTITCASEENQQLKESLAEARAEIEQLRARNAILDNAIVEMTEEQAALCSEGQTITELVAAKDALIEQMREALRLTADEYSLHVSRYENRNAHDDPCYIVAEQALAAERGE